MPWWPVRLLVWDDGWQQCSSVHKPLTLIYVWFDISLILSLYFHSSLPFVFIFSPACTLAVTTSEPLQPLPLCLKQEMSPEVTSTSPSPNMAASNLAFVELQALQKPVPLSSSSSSCGNSNHFPNTFNSFSHHAPVYGQFSSQSIISGNAGISSMFTLTFVQCHFLLCHRCKAAT